MRRRVLVRTGAPRLLHLGGDDDLYEGALTVVPTDIVAGHSTCRGGVGVVRGRRL